MRFEQRQIISSVGAIDDLIRNPRAPFAPLRIANAIA
jgi:hypothetical protein